MMATRTVYCPDAAARVDAGALDVVGEEHRHLWVARVRPGEEVEVFDGAGGVWPGLVESVERRATRVRLGECRRVPPGPVEIVLAQALIHPRTFDVVLGKAVELGVRRIVPFRAERSNDTGRGREARWRRIVVEAAKQSKQYHVPRLDPVAGLSGVLALDGRTRLVFSERGPGDLRAGLGGTPAICVIGPEGGWSGPEQRQMKDAGFHPVHLGRQILRAETAAILAIGLVAWELGALR